MRDRELERAAATLGRLQRAGRATPDDFLAFEEIRRGAASRARLLTMDGGRPTPRAEARPTPKPAPQPAPRVLTAAERAHLSFAEAVARHRAAGLDAHRANAEALAELGPEQYAYAVSTRPAQPAPAPTGMTMSEARKIVADPAAYDLYCADQQRRRKELGLDG